ncbi:hypothetical protein CO669_28490 [Bradyrhizobium sp. Y36]|nr:hypothetical protein CO669_28490 [Bradyrhizobium sp. Y36]
MPRERDDVVSLRDPLEASADVARLALARYEQLTSCPDPDLSIQPGAFPPPFDPFVPLVNFLQIIVTVDTDLGWAGV